MKNLFSLIVAMLLCVGAYAGPKGNKGAIMDKAVIIQVFGANTAAIEQTSADFSEAAIVQVGIHNVGYIQQEGCNNDAGVYAKTWLPSVCSDSYTLLANKIAFPKVVNCGLSFDLICGQTVEVCDIVADLPPFMTGLYQLGLFNLGSIVQDGDDNLAGIAQLGLLNQAGLHQEGDDNKGFINQAGAFNKSVVDQDGDDNTALVSVVGIRNRTLVEQDGDDNLAVQLVEGFMNTAIIDQLGCKNTAIQAVDGAFNTVLTHQEGAYNRAVQTIDGFMNVSDVFQYGCANNAFIEQGKPSSVDWGKGIKKVDIELDRTDIVCGKLIPVCPTIVAPSMNPHVR